MSKLISELRTFSKAISKTLIELIYSADNLNQNDLISLKKCIDTILGCAKDDFDVTHKMLVELLKHCKNYNDLELDRLVNDIKTLCSDNLSQRGSLCAKVITGFFDIKNIARPFLDINLFVDAETHLAFQYLFNDKDVISSIIQCDYQSFIDRVKQSELFAPHTVYVHLTQYQKRLEKNFIAFAKAREAVAPKHFNATDYTVTDEMKERFSVLNKYGVNPFSQSAPTSPVHRDKIIIASTSLSSREKSALPQHAISSTSTLTPSYQYLKTTRSFKKKSDSTKGNRYNVPSLNLHTLHMCPNVSQEDRRENLHNADFNASLANELSASLAKLIIDDEPIMVNNNSKENTYSHKTKVDTKVEKSKRRKHG